MDTSGFRRSAFGFSPIMIVVITVFIDATGFGIIFPLLPFFAETFNAGSAVLSVLFASFALMQFIFSPVLGRISDRVGRKPVLLISLLTSLASCLLFALANSFWLLLLSRIFAGLATETAVAQAYVVDITGKSDRAAGIGKLGAAHGAGFIVGPAIGGFLSAFGFSAPGFAAAILTFVNLLFVIFFLPESLRNRSPKLLSSSSSNGGFLANMRFALAKPLIGATLAVAFVTFLAFSALPVVGPLLSAAFFGFGEYESSYVFMYIGAVHIVLQGLAIGRLSRRFGDQKLITFGPIVTMVGMLLLPLIPNLAFHLVALAMISTGTGIIRTVVPSFISKTTPSDEQGSILGVTNSVASVATVVGPLIGGTLFEYAGIVAPFFASAAMLAVASSLGYKNLSSNNLGLEDS